MCVGACADVPEPEEGSEEQLDPVPLMDRSCVANVLEKVIPCFQVRPALNAPGMCTWLTPWLRVANRDDGCESSCL